MSMAENSTSVDWQLAEDRMILELYQALSMPELAARLPGKMRTAEETYLRKRYLMTKVFPGNSNCQSYWSMDEESRLLKMCREKNSWEMIAEAFPERRSSLLRIRRHAQELFKYGLLREDEVPKNPFSKEFNPLSSSSPSERGQGNTESKYLSTSKERPIRSKPVRIKFGSVKPYSASAKKSEPKEATHKSTHILSDKSSTDTATVPNSEKTQSRRELATEDLRQKAHKYDQEIQKLKERKRELEELREKKKERDTLRDEVKALERQMSS